MNTTNPLTDDSIFMLCLLHTDKVLKLVKAYPENVEFATRCIKEYEGLIEFYKEDYDNCVRLELDSTLSTIFNNIKLWQLNHQKEIDNCNNAINNIKTLIKL